MNKQLVIVRQFFDEARRSPAAQTPFARMRRTLDLDLCIELALGAVAVDHGSTTAQAKMTKKDLQWQELWQAAHDAATTKVQKSLPGGSILRTLHEQRNLAQHRGAVPSAEDIAAWVEPVRTLLDFVCREFYQRDFERLQHWDALECLALRELLTECSTAIQGGEPHEAINRIRYAYERIAMAVQLHVAGTPPPDTMRRVKVSSPAAGEAVNAMSGILHDVQTRFRTVLLAIEAEVMAVGLGLPMADHIRFVRHARGHLPEPDEDAEFMLHYLAKASVMLESALPGILDQVNLDAS